MSPSISIKCMMCFHQATIRDKERIDVNGRNPLNFIINKCTHCAMRPENVPIAQETLDTLDMGLNPSQGISVVC